MGMLILSRRQFKKTSKKRISKWLKKGYSIRVV